MRKVVAPSLIRAGYEPWGTANSIPPGANIHDVIVQAIRRADLTVSEISTQSANTVYELGLTHAWGTPSIILTRDWERLPFDVAAHYSVLPYQYDDGEGLDRLADNLNFLLERAAAARFAVLPKYLDRYVSRRESVRIEFCERVLPSPVLFRDLAELVEALNGIEVLEGARIEEVRIGSVSALLVAAVEKIASIADKLLLAVPETRKRWKEGSKIDDERALIRARTRQTDAVTDAIRDENVRKNIDKLLDVSERLGRGGTFRLTIGDRLQIEAAGDEPLRLDKPSAEDFNDTGWD